MLEFDGYAVRTGEMDVNDLAPSLLSLGRLCSETNAALNGTRATVSVRVRADFKRGSFGIDVHLVQSMVDQMRSFLGSSQVKDVKDILDTLGAIADDVAKIATDLGLPIGLFAIVKRIGRRRVESAEKTGPGVLVKVSDGTIFMADPTAWELYQRPQVRDDLQRFTAPLLQDGFDEIRFKKGQRTTAELTKDDAITLASTVANSGEEVEEIGEIISRDPQTRTWRIRQVPFDSKLTVWRFFEGDAYIQAKMLDQGFVGEVLRHERVFGSGDFLHVEIVMTTRQSADGTNPVSYEILKVLDVIPAPKIPELPRQDPLF